MEVENTMKKTVFIIVVILLLIAFGVSAFMVGRYLINSKEQQQLNDELAAMVGTNPPPTVPETPPTEMPTETSASTVATEPTEPTMIPAYVEAYERNPHMVGWLQIEGTNLNLPVVQTPEDPNFYLKRDFDGNYSEWGTVYAWGAADVSEPSDNITLFGHTMKDKTMFSVLHNYTQEEYWEANKLIFFNTLNEYHTYKIFAVFKTSANIGNFAYHQFVDAANAEEFNDFVDTCKALSFYDTGITPVYGDKLIALSTCEYTLDNGRLVVCAVRMY